MVLTHEVRPPFQACVCIIGQMSFAFFAERLVPKSSSHLFQGKNLFVSSFLSVPNYRFIINRTGSIQSRSARLDEQLQSHARGRGINFLAHSMGGLDCRHLISHIKPTEYVPLSLTSISTPHRGSPFMDWCAVSVFRSPHRYHLISSSISIQLDQYWYWEIKTAGEATGRNFRP